MKRLKKTHILIFLLLVACLVGGVYIWQSDRKTEISIKQKKQIAEILLIGSEKLRQLWIDSPPNLEKSSEVDDEFYRCNPHAMDQFFSKNAVDIKYKKISYLIRAKKQQKTDKFYSIITRANTDGVKIPSYAVLIELYVEGFPSLSLKVLLEDLCHDSYLPQRIYGYGPYDYANDWRWDNFNRHIYVDKHLVTNRDIADWKMTEHQDLSSPSIDLTLEEMEEFCSFRGKALLPAHIFDAATFYPGDLKNIKPIKNPRGPYPWSRISKTFLFNAKHDPYFEFEQGDCGRVYSKDCLDRNIVFEKYDTRSNSWMGIFQVMGGYPQVLRNILNPKQNLVLSSFYYSWKSDWHKLGVRGNFSEHHDKKIGFRCMRFR